MKFQPINLDEWSRGKLFKTYIDNMRIVMCLTADIEVSPVLDFVHRNNLKFYPTMIWIVSKVINKREEFRHGWQDGKVGTYDFVSPYYAHFCAEDEKFAKLVTEYSDDLWDFHSRFLEDRKRFENLRGFDLNNIPPNTFDVSCLPWIKYKSFDMHVFDEGKYLAPVVTWGKYEKEDDKITMPLTMQIHHAVADGFHICRFFKDVQEIINDLPNWK